jgi:hypothetical protein
MSRGCRSFRDIDISLMTPIFCLLKGKSPSTDSTRTDPHTTSRREFLGKPTTSKRKNSDADEITIDLWPTGYVLRKSTACAWKFPVATIRISSEIPTPGSRYQQKRLCNRSRNRLPRSEETIRSRLASPIQTERQHLDVPCHASRFASIAKGIATP